MRLVSSVKSRVLIGFGLIVVILGTSLAGSAFMVRDYQSAVHDMETYSRIASLVQDTRSEAGNAALTLQRFVISGDETDLPVLRESMAAALESGRRAAAEEANSGDKTQALALAQLTAGAGIMVDSADVVIERRQAGDVEGASRMIDGIVPQFRAFRESMDEIANYEMSALSARSADAERTGNLALGLMIVSGISGVIVALGAAYIVTHSITRPLTALETTARRIGEGDLDARAAASGPSEVRNLSVTLNDMAHRLKQREADLVLFNAELRERNRQLLEARAQAATDGLTLLGNHRTFQEVIRNLVPNPDSSPVSLVMLDIDGFKMVNDALGHQKGDEILHSCASAFTATAGGFGVYRYGGDEFAVIVTDLGLDATELLAERLRESVLSNPDFASHRVTISLGVASYPATAGSAEELIYEADAAMYAAKLTGKNRTCRWDSMPTAPDRTPQRRSAPVR